MARGTNKHIFVDDDYEDESKEEDSYSIQDESDKEEKSEETTYKKRGPKKRTIKQKQNVTFKLDDSDIDISEEFIEIKEPNKDAISKNSNEIKERWIEKYRSTNVDDLVLNPAALNKIKKIIEEKDMPNIIITGPPGIGKTTTILCIAKNLLGKYFREGVLELNASDERGVKTVQDSIEYFCKKRLTTDEKCSRHKIVLLDEADNMTKKAQQSIKNLIKQYNDTTRFAFTCNNSSEIIESIQSRCIIFRYCRLNNEQVLQKLIQICENEKISFTMEGLKSIVTTSQGDLREAINKLQTIHEGLGSVVPNNVYALYDKPHPVTIESIFKCCYNKDVRSALSKLYALRNEGYSSSDISISMFNTLKNLDPKIFNEETKIRFMEQISKTCLVISKGIDTDLQLTGCIAFLCK